MDAYKKFKVWLDISSKMQQEVDEIKTWMTPPKKENGTKI